MQLSLEVIDGFRDASFVIAECIGEVEFSDNAFVVADRKIRTEYHLTKTELICVYPVSPPATYSAAQVAFSDIMPSKIIDIHVDEPIKLRESVSHVNLDTWINDGSTPMHETIEYTIEHTTTESLDIASSIETSISEKTGIEASGEFAGIKAGIKQELQLSLSAKLGVNHSTQEQTKTTEDRTRSIDIPAWKQVSITQKKSISDFKQTITTHCQLDAKIRVGVVGGWEKTFESIGEWQLYMLGGGGGSGNVPGLDNFVNQRKFSSIPLPPLDFIVSDDRIYRDVETGEITRTEIDAK